MYVSLNFENKTVFHLSFLKDPFLRSSQFLIELTGKCYRKPSEVFLASSVSYLCKWPEKDVAEAISDVGKW